MARRSEAVILYNGVDISDYVIDFSFTDNSDKTDDISVTLSDREKRFSGDFFPETGDKISGKINLYDWHFTGDNRNLEVGEFEVDNVEFSNTITINAVSIPITSSLRSEKKSRAFENVKLSKIAGELSSYGNLTLVYETDIDPFYDRAEQNNKSDLAFLESLCKADGLALKVSDNQLIIFDESKYDNLPAVMTLTKGVAPFYGYPNFSRNAKNIYKACEITFFDSATDRTYIGFFEAPNVGNVGHTLRLSESYSSASDVDTLNRRARSRLREQNKNEWKLSFSIKGDVNYFAGTNIDIKGFNKLDGKYHIQSVTHSVGSSAYNVSVNTRRTLEGY
jgi:uncharacterized protein